ncbi:MAG: hypothetical protein ABL860_07615 [Candidatus Nitrotoga sp.]
MPRIEVANDRLDGQKNATRAEFLAVLKINPAYYKAKNNWARPDATPE